MALYDLLIIRLMSKKCAKLILQHALRNSPHHTLGRILAVGTVFVPQDEEPEDNFYLDTKIRNIYCENLYESQHNYVYSVIMKTSLTAIEHRIPYKFVVGKKGNKEQVDIENRLIGCIKRLNQYKDLMEVYGNIQDIVEVLDGTDLTDYEKYLMYIFKWIANRNGKAGTQQRGKGDQIKTIIKEKLTSIAKSEHQLAKIKAQFNRIEVLAEARHLNKLGNYELATKNYQQIFQNTSYDQNARMEALEYLCKSSRKRGDESYLHDMINKMKEEKLENRFMRYVENVLREFQGAQGTTEGND